MQFFIISGFLILWTGIFIAYRVKKSNKIMKESIDNFNEKEREANNARRHEIGDDIYFKPDMSAIPFLNDGSKEEERVKSIASRPMIKMPGRVSTTELKLMYGPSQLEHIIICEECYNDYLSALIDLAEHRINDGHKNDGLQLLLYTIGLGSDFRKNYALLIDLYIGDRDGSKLDELLVETKAREFADEGTKNWIISQIMKKKGKLEVV